MKIQRKSVSIMLAMIMMITAVFISPSSFAASNDDNVCTTCSSKGKSNYQPASAEQEKQMVDIIQKGERETAKQFSTHSSVGTREVLIVKDTPDLGFVLDKNTTERSLSIYGVDLTREAVFAHANFAFSTDVNGDQIFTISSSQKVQQFKITSDGKLFDLKTNQEIDVNDVEFANLVGVQTAKNSGEVSTKASCREYVGNMCGLMAGYGMAELCALAALAGGLPGIGCAIVYAAIATWGCSSAMDLFC